LGVAKNVRLVAVKVFGADGTSRYANIIAAIEFVMKRKRQNPNQPMVINLSLGTAQVAELLNEAVNEAVASGIPVVVAAGNSGQDACLFSPSSADLAITVGASTKEE
jgi:subtilisin family serine protease